MMANKKFMCSNCEYQSSKFENMRRHHFLIHYDQRIKKTLCLNDVKPNVDERCLCKHFKEFFSFPEVEDVFKCNCCKFIFHKVCHGWERDVCLYVSQM